MIVEASQLTFVLLYGTIMGASKSTFLKTTLACIAALWDDNGRLEVNISEHLSRELQLYGTTTDASESPFPNISHMDSYLMG